MRGIAYICVPSGFILGFATSSLNLPIALLRVHFALYNIFTRSFLLNLADISAVCLYLYLQPSDAPFAVEKA